MEWEVDQIKYLRENYRHGNCQAIADNTITESRQIRGSYVIN